MELRPTAFLVLAALATFAVGGCKSGTAATFPTAAKIARTGPAQQSDMGTLEAGRRIYTTTCTECHVARPVAHSSTKQWRHRVDIMAPRAGLKPADKAAVEAYLVAARESLPGA